MSQSLTSIDLSTTYLGLKLKNPLVLAASPFTKRVEAAEAVAESGMGAIVMHSLFEEEIVHGSAEMERTLDRGADSSAEASSFLPEAGLTWPSPKRYLDTLSGIKKAVGIPVIGSLNGVSDGGWADYAKQIQDAGADALELNVYYLAAEDARTSAEVEESYLKLVAHVRKSVRIPLAVKIGPYFTALPAFCRRLTQAGADGIVLFNRFYQPDLDLDTMAVAPQLSLSTSDDLRLPLRWTALLHGKTKADIAITTGVHTHLDVVKSMLVGAACTQVAAEVLTMGPSRIPLLLDAVRQWLADHEYTSLKQLQGSMSSKNAGAAATEFERANYLKALRSYDDRLP